MKNLLTFLLVAFLLVFTFQVTAVPKSENSTAVSSVTGQYNTAKRTQPAMKIYSEAERVTAQKIKPGKNKIFENMDGMNSHRSGFV